MAEAEDVITDAAQHATGLVVDYWKRRTQRDAPFEHTLPAHKQRLEILLKSLFNVRIPVRAAQPPARPTVLTRLFTRRPKRLFQWQALPSQDGRSVFLPLIASGVEPADFDAARFYRTCAIQQAQRCLRRRHCNHDRSVKVAGSASATLQTLYQLSEAANADYDILNRYPGLSRDLQLARQSASIHRPALDELEGPEQAIESLYQQLLNMHPGEIPAPLSRCTTPSESFSWAQEYLLEVQLTKQRYWGLETDSWLGVIADPEPDIASEPDTAGSPDNPRPNPQKMPRRPQVREREEEEDDPNSGFWMVQPSPPMEHAEDPMGMQRPVDREKDADAGGLADSLSELEETSVVSTPEPAKEILSNEDAPPSRSVCPASQALEATGIAYPEWDYQRQSYHARGAIVRLHQPELGSADWVTSVMQKNHKQLQEVRRRFEAMRARRQIQRRQLEGEDLDIAEYVAAYADQRAGLPMSDRLFQAERNQRRDSAVLLLIDISGSTDAWVSQQQRIIDVAKESLLLVATALDALGDPFAIQAFSGEGPKQVRVTEIKGFNTRMNNDSYRHIAALEPDRFTRVGCALRHATASLMTSNAQRRLLILLSDGKPNDVDQYETRYGIEDTRQAVHEASLQGIHPFCITVDREAPDYLPYVFGPSRYSVLSQVHKLPVVLLELLRHFMRA